MANLLKLFVVMFALLPCGTVLACSPVSHMILTQEQAQQKAAAVFIGKVVDREVGLPHDFAPANSKFLQEKREAAHHLGIETIGVTYKIALEKNFSGAQGAELNILDLAERRISSCDISYNWQVGDRVVVFANRDGNYFTLPAMLDDLSLYTQIDPVVRYGKVAADHPYAKAIADETARFEKIIQSLPRESRSQVGGNIQP